MPRIKWDESRFRKNNVEQPSSQSKKTWTSRGMLLKNCILCGSLPFEWQSRCMGVITSHHVGQSHDTLVKKKQTRIKAHTLPLDSLERAFSPGCGVLLTGLTPLCIYFSLCNARLSNACWKKPEVRAKLAVYRVEHNSWQSWVWCFNDCAWSPCVSI